MLNNSTIKKNSAATTSGRIVNYVLKEASSTVTIRNSTISNNTGWYFKRTHQAELYRQDNQQHSEQQFRVWHLDHPCGKRRRPAEVNEQHRKQQLGGSRQRAQRHSEYRGSTCPAGVVNGPGDIRNTNPVKRESAKIDSGTPG